MLNEEHWFITSENFVLMRIFEIKKPGDGEDYNNELRNLYFWLNILGVITSRGMEGGHVARMVKMRCIIVSVTISGGMKTPKHRCEN
jgi:hypothetical protein